MGDIQGIIAHYELWDSNQTITSNLYCNLFSHLKKTMDKHDSTRPHTDQWTKNLLKEHCWENASVFIFSVFILLLLLILTCLDGLRLTSREKVQHQLFSYAALKSKVF